MTNTPTIISFDGATTAVIQVRSTYDKLKDEIASKLEELAAIVKAQEIELSGPFFVRYHRMDEDCLYYEVGVMTKTPVQEEQKVLSSVIPAYKRVARVTHKGSYEKLPDTWKAFFQWIEEEKLSRNPEAAWECYVVTPGMTSNPEEWVTEIYNPIGD